MVTDTIIEDARWRAAGLENLSAAAAAGALRELGLDPVRFEICVLGCDDARMAKLNAAFRGRPQPTNVLSWPAGVRARGRSPGDAPDPPRTSADDPPAGLGDIAVAYETCAREAAEAGKSMADHVTHLIVHGALHLLGYDHISDKDAAAMEALEIKILGKLGIPDPYEG